MAKLNTIACVALSGGNTGYGECVLDPAHLVGAILVPANFRLNQADIADPIPAFQAVINEIRANRVYPMPPFEEVTDNTGDLTTQTFTYGGIAVVRESDYDFTFLFKQGGFCANKGLRKFNGQGKYVMFIDANGVLYGAKDGETLGGIPLKLFHTDIWRIATGDAVSRFLVRFVFDPSYFNEGLGFIQLNLADFRGLKGLQDVAIKKLSRAAGVINVRLEVGCSGINLYDQYAAELADPALWIAKNAQTGNLIDITSVAANANNSGFTVTLLTTDPDYTTAGVTLELANPVTLEGSGVPGVEAAPVLITI